MKTLAITVALAIGIIAGVMFGTQSLGLTEPGTTTSTTIEVVETTNDAEVAPTEIGDAIVQEQGQTEPQVRN